MEQWPKSACTPIESRPTGPLVADRVPNLLHPSPAGPFRCAKEGSCGGMNRWRLVLPERERFGLVYARETVRHRRGDTIRTTRALLSLPLQHLSQRLAVEVPPIIVRKLADGKVRLLLAGTRSAEGYTQDLHLCATRTGTLCVDAYLARSRLRYLGQRSLCSTALRPSP
jgi:hypothetical protein